MRGISSLNNRGCTQEFSHMKKRRVLVPRTQETRNQITRAGRATSHVYPGDKSPIFYKTASAEIAPCDIIIAPLLGRARDSGDAVAGGYHLRVPLRSQNRDFFTPRGEKSVSNNTKTPRRWQFFRHLSGTDLTLRVTVSPRCPSPSQDSTRHASTFYRAGGGFAEPPSQRVRATTKRTI